MDGATTLLELLKYTVPAIVVLVATYLVVNKFLVEQTRRKQMALFEGVQDTTLRLRLQAYERLVVFVERIHPRQLIPRIYTPGMTVNDLQFAMMTTIRAEFEHNLSQQIYVSRNAWETVKNVKEQELNMINNIAGSIDPELPGRDLHARILEFLAKSEGEQPTEVALHILNSEVRAVLSFGM